MFDVIVSDKLKDCLPAGTLNYVLSNLEADGTFLSSKKLQTLISMILIM